MKHTDSSEPTQINASNFREQIQKLQKALLVRGYKEYAVKTLLKNINFRHRQEAIHKQKPRGEKTPGTPTMMLTYNNHIHTVREELQKIWLDVKEDPILNQLYPEPPRIALKRNRSLRDMLVRAKLQKKLRSRFQMIHKDLTFMNIAEFPQTIQRT